MTSLEDGLRDLGFLAGIVTPTCTVCAKRLHDKIRLSEFDFDETGDDTGVSLASVTACGGCWRKCLTELAEVLEGMPASIRVGIMADEAEMQTLIDEIVRKSRRGFLEGRSP